MMWLNKVIVRPPLRACLAPGQGSRRRAWAQCSAMTATSSTIRADADPVLCDALLRRFDAPGPRYTSYPTADRFVNNMLSFYIDPAGLGLAAFFKEDVARLTEWIRSTPPARPGDKVRAPGDVELATKAERLANGIPLDPTTIAQLVAAGKRTGVSAATLARLEA